MFAYQRRQSGFLNLGGALVAALALVFGSAATWQSYSAGAPATTVDQARCELVCRTLAPEKVAGNNG